LFCLFAEDIDLLPNKLFTELLEAVKDEPAMAQQQFATLLGAMATGGLVGFKRVAFFNGGLFTDAQALPLELADIKALLTLAALDWSAIDPTIAGTLFVRSLDPALRAQLGAEYTDPATIMRLVNPVVLDPLRAEWTTVKAQIQTLMDKVHAAKSPAAATKAKNAAMELYQGFLHRLQQFRVLDPACGSGNFLLLTLLGLRDLEHQVITEAESLGLARQFPAIGPENLLGIEINPFAAELARVSLWIGEIQWMLNHGFSLSRSPILRNLDNIQLRDAILNPDGTEPEWPEADAIVGNPPFLGGSKKRGVLGDENFYQLAKLYSGRVPAGADLVTYWFEKARAQIAAGRVHHAGLVATQSIRKGANRQVLDQLVHTAHIFCAWSDEPWINEGASVRVSLVAFSGKVCASPKLNGIAVEVIHADLTGGTKDASDLGQARPLVENFISFEGTKKYGDFDIPGQVAREWLTLPNPHGKPNSDVVKPWRNGLDITRRPSDTWIIDFGTDMAEVDASFYELPFQHLTEKVKPYRDSVRRERTRRRWWIHEEARVGLRKGLIGLNRYIATPRVAKHRFFVWLAQAVLPDTRLYAICRQDDVTFGILSSRPHLIWALANASRHGVGNDPTQCH
jgi:type II restriction/modification system DNA methylase subunit YeeA